MFLYSNELQVGKFQVKKLVNVWRPHFKFLPFNHYMSQNKTFTRKPSNTWNPFLHKIEIWLETWNNGKKLFLTHLKFEAFNNLKLSTIWKTFFHTFSNFNIETLNKSNNSIPHFKPKTWILKTWKKTFSTLENLQHFEEVSSTPPTHLEML